MVKEKERYFACPTCKEPTTWSQILEECGSGGQGMCYCQYQSLEWSDKYKDFEPVCDRVFIEYVEITKVLYDALKKCDVQTRIQHVYIPESQTVKKPIYCDKCKKEIVKE